VVQFCEDITNRFGAAKSENYESAILGQEGKWWTDSRKYWQRLASRLIRSKEIQFIGSQFDEFPGPELSGSDESILPAIIGSTEVEIRAGDSRHRVACDLVETDRNHFSLRQCLHFEFAWSDISKAFGNLISQNLDLIDPSILSNTGRRLFFVNASVSESNPRQIYFARSRTFPSETLFQSLRSSLSTRTLDSLQHTQTLSHK